MKTLSRRRRSVGEEDPGCGACRAGRVPGTRRPCSTGAHGRWQRCGPIDGGAHPPWEGHGSPLTHRLGAGTTARRPGTSDDGSEDRRAGALQSSGLPRETSGRCVQVGALCSVHSVQCAQVGALWPRCHTREPPKTRPGPRRTKSRVPPLREVPGSRGARGLRSRRRRSARWSAARSRLAVRSSRPRWRPHPPRRALSTTRPRGA